MPSTPSSRPFKEPYNRQRLLASDRALIEAAIHGSIDYDEGIIDDTELERRRLSSTLDENQEAENRAWALSQVEEFRLYLKDAQGEPISIVNFLNQLPGAEYRVSVLYAQESFGESEDQRSIFAVKVIDLRHEDLDQFHIDLRGVYMDNSAALKAAEEWNKDK